MSGECILIIDDSAEMVKHLADNLLPTFGYKTQFAFDGRSGLKLIRETTPDLIMLDFNLPEMTGIDILQQMAQESISIPVVLMTGYGSELSAIEAFRLGAKDYLIKPFTVDEVVETIDRALVETRLLHDKQEIAEQLRRSKVEMSRLTHQMNTLSSIGKAITSLLSVDKVLERVLEAATYLTNSEQSTIWLPDSSGTELYAYEKKGRYSPEEQLPKLSISDSQAGEVMRAGRPLRMSSFTGQGVKVETGYFARAILYIPLKLRNVTMGVLGVSNLVALRSFSKRDEFLLAFLADYAAIALENARVFQAADSALASRLDELHTLIEITRTITSSLDLDEVIKMTIQQVHHSWHIEASSIWLIDETKNCLRILANVGTPADVLSDIEVPIGEGFVGHVAKTGKWIYTNDVSTHPLHYQDVDNHTGFLTRSLLCVPLILRGKVIGTLEVLNKQDGEFDDQDIERGLSIAAAVAIAVSNALLFKEAESRKQHLETTLEYNNSPMLIMDGQKNLMLLNQEARHRLGLTTEAAGKPIADVLEIPELLSLLSNPDSVNDDQGTEIILPDGSIWLSRFAPIPEHGYILVLQDIMSIKQLEMAKDNFVASLTHDMRAPLNTISGFAATLSQAGPLNDEQQMFVQRILDAIEHMMEMVNGLLELAKVNTKMQHEFQPCDLVAITQDVVAEFLGQAMAQNIQLDIALQTDKGMVYGDPYQLRSAVSNLVDNAIKYSPPDETIRVDVSHENDHVLVAVHDNGLGIDESDLPHIFDKFYRGRKSRNIGGSGLGLALVRSVAKSHRGKVWAESKGEPGSQFFLEIPAIS